MKKADIILTFNNLQVELQTVADHYQAVTGETHPKVDEGVLKNLGWHAENWGKDYLQDLLNLRQRLIKQIPEDEIHFLNTQKMKESEEGQAFIKGLEEKHQKLLDEMKGINDIFHKSFEFLLESIGLGEWKLNPNAEIYPTFGHLYFNIYNDADQWCNTHITIDRRDGDWKFSPSIALCSGTDEVRKKNTQYRMCQAYVTFFDHNEEVHKWLEETYSPLATKVYDLSYEIEKMDEKLADPYTAWVESK